MPRPAQTRDRALTAPLASRSLHYALHAADSARSRHQQAQVLAAIAGLLAIRILTLALSQFAPHVAGINAPRLAPLSRDHHHALVLAQRLRRATTQTAPDIAARF